MLLHGDSSFLVEEEAAEILARWREDLVSDFGFETLDALNVSVERLRDALLQAPFLDPHRVVAVRGLAARRADGLAAALDEVPETTRVLVTVVGRLQASSRLVKSVAALGGRVTAYAEPRGRELQSWVARRAAGLGLSAAVGADVARRAQPDLGVLDSELRKLAAYRAAGGRIDRDAVAELVVADHPQEIFRLTDNLLPRPTGEAWRVLDDLLRREGPTLIAYRIARHVSTVLEARTRLDRGESLSAAQSAMSEHPFVVQKAYDAARVTPAERLEAALRVLLDYEWEVKSGQIDAAAGLPAALARI